jgi:hypothetical protein
MLKLIRHRQKCPNAEKRLDFFSLFCILFFRVRNLKHGYLDIRAETKKVKCFLKWYKFVKLTVQFAYSIRVHGAKTLKRQQHDIFYLWIFKRLDLALVSHIKQFFKAFEYAEI